MKLATQDKPFFPDNFIEKLMMVKDLGFDAYEVDGNVLVNRFEEVEEAVVKTGVSISSVCGGYRGWIGDFQEERRRQALQDIEKILKCAGKIGAKGIVVPAAWGMFSLRLPPLVPPRSPQEDRAVLLDSLGKLDIIAERTGTVILFEPLNRYEDHMVNTLGAAKELILAGGFKHVQITADFFHMNIEEKDIARSIIECGNLIGHVHIADSHRYQPGDGHMDFVSGFKALHDIGFDGYMAFECRVLGDDPVVEYRKSVEYIKQCIAKVVR
ncbi:sugar phosphate isomerase/epimerase [Caldicoprobacter algeriensis]|uniref:sugar phosphate isomerase/epimerase family protein n=1 Tax=Caldicoprobacter algeriensis TaxID=699281 RepID=UPI00207A17F9|nr:sugar phosphate isomerase/epimerase family protein [Caldicoprobacter algeriensis]MCM8900433.1 sugar phosphate isomerase/epimerase [Caldicoprobacter algeriensis]